MEYLLIKLECLLRKLYGFVWRQRIKFTLKHLKKKEIVMWLSAIKLAVNAGSHIYKKKKRNANAYGGRTNASCGKMAKGELEYSGKLLEARQSDWKDEFVLIVSTLPILVIAYGVFSDDPGASAKIKEFFEQFQQLPSWFTNLWILVCCINLRNKRHTDF